MSNTYQKERRRAQPDWSPVDRQAAGGQPGAAEEILVCAAKAAMGLRNLAALAAEIYERSRPGLPDQDPTRAFGTALCGRGQHRVRGGQRPQPYILQCEDLG